MADPELPTPTPGPRRIRSLPDRVTSQRPAAGGIRSLPDRAPAATRLPVVDGGDKSWRRGIAVLWTLFGLIAVGEAFLLAIYLLAGGAQWPRVGDVVRLTVLCGVFLSLWFGWSWTRWVLAVLAFFAGGRTLVLILATSGHVAGADYLTSSELLGSLFFTGSLVALGTLYLVLCAYLVFSADVLAFTEHRRQKGRGWVVVPVALLLGAYWLAMLGADFALRRWLATTVPSLRQLAHDDAQRMASGWDPASLAAVLDTDALRNWPPASREGFMQAGRPLGTYLGPGDESAHAFFFYDPSAGGLTIRAECQEIVRCVNGRATFGLLMARPLAGPWSVTQVMIGEVQLYKPPAPEPTANPAATPVPSTGG